MINFVLLESILPKSWFWRKNKEDIKLNRRGCFMPDMAFFDKNEWQKRLLQEGVNEKQINNAIEVAYRRFCKKDNLP